MDGYIVTSYCVLEIRKNNGEVIYSWELPQGIKVLDDEIINNCGDL